jgi:hypothetical protein
MQECRIAAINDIWVPFVEKLRLYFIPRAILTVDEQLLGYRGYIPGRTYIPSKPRKYGLKIFWLCDADSGYALNAQMYLGKENNAIHHNLGLDVVLSLSQPYYNTGREIVTDNFFTSYSLAKTLLEKNLTLLGTIRNHRKEIPDRLKNKNRPVSSTEFSFDHEHGIMLASYIPKRNKNVILLSSSHCSNATVEGNKPALILDYNYGKKGVDQFDQNIEEFTCRRKTVRWPLLLFFNMLDVAAFNGYLLMKFDGYKKHANNL